MRTYLKKTIEREHLLLTSDIIKWWNKGRGLLNVLFFLYSFLYIVTVLILGQNGWIFFLIIPLLGLFIIINILFSLGLFIEIITLKLFKSNIDFDKIGPKIKIFQFLLAAIFVLGISLWELPKLL